LGHFGYSWCLQRLCWAVRLFETNFAQANFKEQVAVLFWITSSSRGNAGPQT
jgi:hypothetical protein